jgi:hypothetical protein
METSGIFLNNKKVSNQVKEEWPFLVYNIRELETLVDLEKGPVDWDRINRSWVVSHDLEAEVSIITVRNGVITRVYNDETIIEETTLDCDIQLEVHETKDENFCVDVISYYGDTLDNLSLVERLAKVSFEIANDLELTCHQYFAYNENTISVINKQNVVNFIIQNSLDPYTSTRKRLVTIKVNKQDLQECEYGSLNIINQKEVTLIMRDIQENKIINEIECTWSWIKPFPVAAALREQSFMLRIKKWRVRLPYLYARSASNGRRLRYEMKLLSINHVNQAVERKGFFSVKKKGYVADRQLEKVTKV